MKLMIGLLFISGVEKVYEVRQNEPLNADELQEKIAEWSEEIHRGKIDDSTTSLRITDGDDRRRIIDLRHVSEVSFWISQ